MTNHNIDTSNRFTTHDKHKVAGYTILGLGVVGVGLVLGHTFNSESGHNVNNNANSQLLIEMKNKASLDAELTEDQMFDLRVLEAIENGPVEGESTILAVKSIGKDSSAANAFIREAREVGYDLSANEDNNHKSLTASATEFNKANGGGYQPDDLFVLYEQDINADGVNELFAKAVEADK